MGDRKAYNLDGGVPLWKLPAGVCSECGRHAFGMHQVGGTCFHCGKGTFINRGKFEWVWCHCGWRYPFCPTCRGKGIVPKAIRSADP